MSRRLDVLIQAHPDREEAIRELASRDPSGNLKYLDWQVKVLVSGQALAPEIADVIDLFHEFNERWLDRRQRVRSDIYSYRPQDLANLRNALLKLKRAQDRKRKKRERLYHIEGPIEAEVIYDSPELIVRHIKNKNASVHYGLGTKWCIAMAREGYFEDYETNNATFFFFERKVKKRDAYDKVALVVPRDNSYVVTAMDAFTSLDDRVDVMALAAAYGLCVFDIFRAIYVHAERYPGSLTSQVYAGKATAEQLTATYETVAKCELNFYETASLLTAICCNDAAPKTLLDDILHNVKKIALVTYGRMLRMNRRRKGRNLRSTKGDRYAQDAWLSVAAAMAIHPNVEAADQKDLLKVLRRHRISHVNIHRRYRGGRVDISCHRGATLRGRRLRHRRRQPTLRELTLFADRYERRALRTRKKIAKLQEKLASAKTKTKRKRS